MSLMMDYKENSKVHLKFILQHYVKYFHQKFIEQTEREDVKVSLVCYIAPSSGRTWR